MLKIHKASAGSGKTFTLAKEYIRLLIGYTDADGRQRLRPASAYGFGRQKPHSAILAVTFTNKATQEMIQRIVKELYNLSLQNRPGAPESNYLADFRRTFNATTQQIAEAAGRALSDLLFNFSYFNVSTLDSFFQTIVRSFARDLDLPENYNLEISQEYPVASSVSDMFADLNRPEPESDLTGKSSRRRHLEHTIEQFMLQEAAEGRGAQLLSRSSGVFGNVVSFINSLINETWKFNRTAVESYLADSKRITAFSRTLAEHTDAAFESARMAAQAILDTGADQLIRVSVLNFCRALVRGERPPALPADITAALDGTKSPLKNVRPKAEKALREAVAPEVESAVEGFRCLRNAYFFDYIRRHLYLLALFGHATRSLRDFCHDRELFLLSDTNDLLRQLIDESDAPFIYDRVGTRIEHYLIDEFQDTSRMQWENLRPLVMESMSRGSDNLIIGDEKQCIYRFRNSDPELLGHIASDAAVTRFGSESVETHGHTIEENTNWRSAPEIVRFNNTMYRLIARDIETTSGSDGVTAATYAGIVQKLPSKGRAEMPAGYVEAIFFGADTSDYEERTLAALTKAIERQLEAGYSPGDIAVLVRGRKEGQLIIDHLLRQIASPDWRHGPVRIVSADALTISANPSVKTIINLLRLITLPETVTDITKTDEDGNPARVINGEWLRRRLIHRYQLALFDTETPRTPSEALALALDETIADEKAGPSQHSSIFTDPDSLVNCPNLFELVERVIAEALPAHVLERDCAFITALQDLVLDFQDTGHNDVETFLEWWDATGAYATLSAPEGVNAISVMTIHKAKGLEFPCVHVPFMDRPMNYVNSKDRVWYALEPEWFPGIDPELVPPVVPLPQTSSNLIFEALAPQYETTVRRARLDALNVAYVATTRAVNELCIYARRADKPDSQRLGERLYQAATAATPEFVAADELYEWLISIADKSIPTAEEPDTAGVPESKTALERFVLGSYTVPTRGKFSREMPHAESAGTEQSSALDSYQVAERGELSVKIDPESGPRERGNFLHSVLAKVHDRSDLERAVQHAAYRRHMTPEDTRECLELLGNALNDPRVQSWFSGYKRVITERPASAVSNDVRRPDRIVWHPDGSVSVIDYKFGELKKKQYYTQVHRYMKLLAPHAGGPVRGYLWYPLSSEIIPVK